MSTPPFLAPPEATDRRQHETARGAFSTWILDPPDAEPIGTGILIPGFTGSKEDFVAILGPLALAGWRVVTFDQRGQHESPGGSVEGYTLSELAADALALTGATAVGPTHLVGHSFGGLVAREAVLANPRAFQSLTLLCSGPSGVGGPTAEIAHLFAAALDTMPIEHVWDAKVAYDASQQVFLPEDPVIAGFLRDRFIANDPAGLAAVARLLTSAPDHTAELAATGVPVLVAYGEQDEGWPQDVQESMAARLSARCVVIAGSGHSPAAECPEETSTLLGEFWAEADSTK